MKRTLLSYEDRFSATLHGIFCVFIALFFSSGLHAQTPEEHASHHPGGAAPAAGAMPAAPGATPAVGGMPAAGGGMMEQMGEMMKGMGKPPPKELYPTLMALPELTPEQRKDVEDQANGRMYAGSNLIGQALDDLNAGTVSGDYAAMHKATSLMREGTAQLESGIAARQALAEGRAPRDVALAWFKSEMRIQPGTALGGPQKSGPTVFHLFTMVLLIAFALAMVAMYFFKMRRAAALFGRIEADKKSPPPGSAPELAGGKPPSAEKPAAP
jgi:hypothetical protein